MSPTTPFRFLTALAAALMLARTNAHGQLFVQDYSTSSVYDYSLTGQLDSPGTLSTPNARGVAISGTTVEVAEGGSTRNSSVVQFNDSTLASGGTLVGSLNNPTAIGAGGSFVYVGLGGSGGVNEYNASTGSLVASMASGASNSGIAVAGSYVFVANGANGSIGEYTINPVTGALLSSNASFLTGLTNPLSLAAAGSTLYFANGTTVGAYAFNPSTGALASTTPTWTALETLVTGTPAIAVSGSNLFVTNGGSEVAEYTTSGTLENADVLTITQGSITGLAVTPVPEPGDGAAVLGAAALALALVRRRPVAA